MSDDIVKEKLERLFLECDKHILRINHASKKMETFFPLNVKKYENLNDDEVAHIDQFLFRFAKLQDTMGQKLFRFILLFLNEDIEGKPFIDILNLLEKLNLLKSVNEWKELREDRNELSHNYDDNPEEMAESLNKLFQKRKILINIYDGIKSSYNNRLHHP